jgi:hypothetical protein
LESDDDAYLETNVENCSDAEADDTWPFNASSTLIIFVHVV